MSGGYQMREYRLWPYWLGLSVVDVNRLPPFHRTSGTIDVGEDGADAKTAAWPGWQLGYVD